MSEKLTPKQEAFAQKYYECSDASKAYRHAYDCENMTANSIHVNASKQLKHAKVALRIEELQAKATEIAEKRFTITVEQRLEWLKDIVEAGLSQYADGNGQARREGLSAAKGAIETINSMLGTGGEDEDKGEKLNITFNVSDPVRDVKVTRGE
ncbi:terminase small subunit, partial [Vibrio phage 1.148.O._10N.286.54.A10]